MRSHDGRTAVAAVELHALAAFAFPGEQFVIVFEAGDQRVVKLPVVFEVVPAARRSHAFRIVNAKRPATDVHFVSTVVERLAGSVDFKPVPVVGMDVIFVWSARSGALP